MFFLLLFFLFIEIADDNLLLYQRQLEGAVVQVPKAIIIKKSNRELKLGLS
jgi:hypothetical protein